jgi:hypothetical protein
MIKNTFKSASISIIILLVISACKDINQENDLLNSTIWNESENLIFNPEGGYESNVLTGKKLLILLHHKEIQLKQEKLFLLKDGK